MILQALDELVEFVDVDDEMSKEQRIFVQKQLMNIEDKDGGDEESVAPASWWVGRSPLSQASPLAMPISASPWMDGSPSP